MERNEVLVTIAAGCYFGEVPMLVNHQEKRSATAQAAEVCNLYALSGPDLKDLIKDFPQTKAYVEERGDFIRLCTHMNTLLYTLLYIAPTTST